MLISASKSNHALCLGDAPGMRFPVHCLAQSWDPIIIHWMESNGRLYRRLAQGRCRARNQQNSRQLKQLDSLQFLLIDFSVQICCQHGLLVSKKINNQRAVMALVVQRLAAYAISGAMLHEFPGLDRTLALRRSKMIITVASHKISWTPMFWTNTYYQLCSSMGALVLHPFWSLLGDQTFKD